jgi:hypothetical protein
LYLTTYSATNCRHHSADGGSIVFQHSIIKSLTYNWAEGLCLIGGALYSYLSLLPFYPGICCALQANWDVPSRRICFAYYAYLGDWVEHWHHYTLCFFVGDLILTLAMAQRGLFGILFLVATAVIFRNMLGGV